MQCCIDRHRRVGKEAQIVAWKGCVMSTTNDNIRVTTTPALLGLTEAGHATATDKESGTSVTRSYFNSTPEAKNDAIRESVAEVRARK